MSGSQASGRGRRLARMVVANRPWRLVLGLRSALAAVFAASLYLVITSTIWQLSSMLGWPKLVITMVVAVTVMVVWILSAHDLWLGADDVDGDDDAALENLTTVITLAVGVLVMAAVTFVVNVVVALFFLQPPMFSGGLDSYLRLGWLAAALATVGGALGSGLDSDSAVLRATYSREQRARRERHRSSATDRS